MRPRSAEPPQPPRPRRIAFRVRPYLLTPEEREERALTRQLARGLRQVLAP